MHARASFAASQIKAGFKERKSSPSGSRPVQRTPRLLDAISYMLCVVRCLPKLSAEVPGNSEGGDPMEAVIPPPRAAGGNSNPLHGRSTREMILLPRGGNGTPRGHGSDHRTIDLPRSEILLDLTYIFSVKIYMNEDVRLQFTQNATVGCW
jgi:hypothetical protein